MRELARGSRRRSLMAAGVTICLLGGASVGLAGVTGSRHDFTGKSIDLGGVCTPCHNPHYASYTRGGWPRDMSAETNYFNQGPGQLGNPDYRPNPVLLCYDCHDDGATTATVDNDPAPGVWSLNQAPQDLAFNGALVGNYETACGGIPGTGGNTAPTDGSPTGGHYWKSDPNGPGLRGDKIACSLCHDPHKAVTGTNEAFFRQWTWNGTDLIDLNQLNGYGTDLRASANTRNGTGTGRQMCATCHAYSDQGSLQSLFGVSAIRPPAGVTEHVRNDLPSAVPCTSCHGPHGANAGCNDCHGYPPMLTSAEGGGPFDRTHATRRYVENYAGGAGAHRRHRDALGAAIFDCAICHGPNPGRPGTTWHNQTAGASCNVVSQANVDIMGRSSSWDPSGTRTTAYTGAFSSVPVQAGYEFSAKGGGDQRCAGLACHGDPPNNAGDLNWIDDMVDGDTDTTVENPAAGDIRICKWCHDGTPAVIDRGAGAIVAPNVMGTGGSRGTAANFGAEVNGHGLDPGTRYDKNAVAEATPTGPNGAGKECIVCHDALYTVGTPPPPLATVPNRTHFDDAYDSGEKRLQATINSQPVAGPNDACTVCHQHSGAAAGTQVPQHTNMTGPYTTSQQLEADFSRLCRQCHEVHGGSWNEWTGTRNLNMIGKWLDLDRNGQAAAGESARVDTNNSGTITTADGGGVAFTARLGANSFDPNNGQPSRNICRTCHQAATGGGDHLDTNQSDFRGLTPGQADCTDCHYHVDPSTVLTDPVANWNGAFMPTGCEGCHGKDCKISKGKDAVAGTADDAPNVMTTSCPSGDPPSGPGLSVWNGQWWNSTQGGNPANQHGGHGDPGGLEGGNITLTPTCMKCHATAYPPGTHLDGTYNSLGTELPMPASPWNRPAARPKANQNTNTSHLLPDFFTTPKYPAVGGGDYRWQVAMDNYCYSECHDSNSGTDSYTDMRHEHRTGVLDPSHNAIQLGLRLTRSTPLTYFMDADLTTSAAGLPNFAPCVSCHNPHGSMNTDSKGSGGTATNWMLIDDWQRASTLCANCHQ